MKTKSRKSHFTCEFRTYNSAGILCYEDTDHKFTAFSAKDYIDRSVKRYASHGMTAEYKNVVNLDEEPATIELEDHIPGQIIEPLEVPEREIPEDWDI